MIKLDEIFDIRYGNGLELINCEVLNEGIPFISRTSSNNGMVSRVKIKDEIEPMPAFAITVALGGSVLSSFFQPEEFYTSFHIYCLYPKLKLTASEMLYYCAIIEKNKYRYNYGRQANKTLKDIRVPSIDEINTKIDSLDVEHYFPKTPLLEKEISLDTSKWSWFRFDKIFTIEKGKRLTKEDMIDGNTIFIGSTELNNGITTYMGNDESLHSPNTITVSYNGSIAEAFYQTSEYWASDDINVLYPKFSLNKYVAMFLITIINREKYRFNYGRKWHKEKMTQSKLKLPVNTIGQADWQFMEDYIKSLPYSRSL